MELLKRFALRSGVAAGRSRIRVKHHAGENLRADHGADHAVRIKSHLHHRVLQMQRLLDETHAEVDSERVRVLPQPNQLLDDRIPHRRAVEIFIRSPDAKGRRINPLCVPGAGAPLIILHRERVVIHLQNVNSVKHLR